jgi:hypothetical protein
VSRKQSNAGRAATDGAAARPRGITVRDQAILAAGLMGIIVMVGFVHAPVVPVVIGSALACAVYFWRERGGRR